jgi:hypothetical protein
MSPEEKARLVIDRKLEDVGWKNYRQGCHKTLRNYGSAEVVDEVLKSLNGFMLAG